MTSYAPVAGSGGVIHGQRATEGGHFMENAGARREWWWQDGPVDSCCFCCNLRTGVGLMAGLDLLWGIMNIMLPFFMDIVYIPLMEQQLKASQEKYSSECQDHVASTLDCEDLNETIGEVKAAMMVTTGIFFVQGLFFIIVGAVGLWAVSTCNPRAAKAFMLSFPARLLLKVLAVLIHLWTSKSNMEQATGAIIWLIHALDVVLLVYYFKVSWSYYKRSRHYRSARGRASSNAENQEQYMIAMTNVV